MASDSGAKPYVTSFQGKTQISSSDFLKIFKSFDKDGKVDCNISMFFFSLATLKSGKLILILKWMLVFATDSLSLGVVLYFRRLQIGNSCHWISE